MKFVDLFAGIGGFHLGMANSGGFECVFACEIDSKLRELYRINYGLEAAGDIREVDEKSVPEHDVLCAGFPCQPFSIAGSKKGNSCNQYGSLIEDVLRIARHGKPEFIILENVPGILTISNGEFWNYLKRSFAELGYQLVSKIISPEDVGLPQNRKRLFVVGSLSHGIASVFNWQKPRCSISLEDVIDEESVHRDLETKKKRQLEKWQQLLSHCEFPVEMPCLTISAQEFGATYPLDFSSYTLKQLQSHRGAYGNKLRNCKTWCELLERMPIYCRKTKAVPKWLQKSVVFSRDIYETNENFLNEWCVDFNRTYNSWQLLEWRGDKYVRSLNCYILQFRASGIRVMKANKIPTLVAMTRTQVPIFGATMRYLSVYEAMKLQNLQALTTIHECDGSAFRAIGNAVNTKIVELIANNLKSITKEKLG